VSELVDRLLIAAGAYAEDPAVIGAMDEVTTYGELFGRAMRAAHALTVRGLEFGDRVACWTDDSVVGIEAYLACALAGLVVVPLNASHTPTEVASVVRDTEPGALVWSGRMDGAVEELRDAGELDGCLLARTGTDDHAGSAVLDSVSWTQLTGSGRGDPPRVVLAEDALLAIGHTSGTTGTPKGALITHGSAAAIARQHELAYRLQPRSTLALTGSLSFVSVVPAHVLPHLVLGGRILMLGRWDVASLLDRIERQRATFTYLPSPVLRDFAEQVERRPRRIDSLHSLLHSASKAPPGHLLELVRVSGTRLVEGWGMTENSGGLMTATTVADLEQALTDPGILGTVGRPLPGYDVRVDGDELLVRGPGLVRGYWRRPEDTTAAFCDGWFRTGDIGQVDEAGRVTVVERRTDLIVSGGMNVYPAEVEQAIESLDDVVECAVVGAPHERWGQTVVAAVVRRPGSQLSSEDVVAACRRQLASYKKPTEVVFLTALPRNAALKVSRAEVRRRVIPAPFNGPHLKDSDAR
jgi:fatty-acyl-CoA synthase